MFTCSNFLSLIENAYTILYYDASVARKKKRMSYFNKMRYLLSLVVHVCKEVESMHCRKKKP